MSTQGGTESLPWSRWVWNEKKQLYQSDLRDSKGQSTLYSMMKIFNLSMNAGKVIKTRWGEKTKSPDPRSATKKVSLPSRPNEEQQEASSPKYSYKTPVTLNSPQEAVEPPNPPITPTLPHPYPSDGRPPLSEIPGQYPAPSGYDQNVSNAPSEHHTTPSGWPAPSPLPHQYLARLRETTPGQYDNPYGHMTSGAQQMYRVPSNGQNTPSHFRGQNTAPAASMAPGPYYETRAPAGSTWSSEYHNRRGPLLPQMAPPGAQWQYGSPTGQNTSIQYQNFAGPRGQTTPSWSEVNRAPQNVSYAPNHPSAPRENRNYFPGATGSRPQSMYISYASNLNSGIPQLDTESSASYENSSVGDATREVANSTSTTHSRKGSSVGTLFYSHGSTTYTNSEQLINMEDVLSLDTGTRKRHQTSTRESRNLSPKYLPRTKMVMMVIQREIQGKLRQGADLAGAVQ
jgi:hypothetical protein